MFSSDPIREASFDRNRFRDPTGPLHFLDSSFRGVRFEAGGGGVHSLAGSSFTDCRFEQCYFGPATLDLSDVSFAGATLVDVEFMLGKLAGSSFEAAELRNVTFRRANLTGASFRGALLSRVCFEKATLNQADFTGCRFVDADFWGEPPWAGAIVDDAVRYSFGVVHDPVCAIGKLLRSGKYTADQTSNFERLQGWLRDWAPEGQPVMLLHRELADHFNLPTFAWMLRELKAPANPATSDGPRASASPPALGR
jgi:hypothetical protein